MKPVFRTMIMRADFLLALLVYPSARILKRLRDAGIEKFPHCRNVLLKVGVFPVSNHYYEPQFDMREVSKPFSEKRNLPAISWNIDQQLGLLKELKFAHELETIPIEKSDKSRFFLDNRYFEQGDVEFWYQLIRAKKPKRIYEIGSGYSTLVAIMALQQNRKEGAVCEHVCIEPFEVPWLDAEDVTVLRQKVEEVELDVFGELEEGDILFIDSSHIIRPEGDVLFEYLEVLPSLNKGVIVHVHDIFSPRNYPESWLIDKVRFWNEQYLLEAFLSGNNSWEIVASLNYLHYDYADDLKAVCPFIKPGVEPKSFYLRKK